jgi:predicted RNA-binding protein with PIN domain
MYAMAMESGFDYIVIDGYNVINAWRDLIDTENNTLEECREKLLNILSNYQGYSRENIIVVFDAHMRKGWQETKEKFDNLTVVFTKRNQTADNYIERLVYKLSKDHIIGVVTSDYLEQRIVLTSGGARITPRELLNAVRNADKNIATGSRSTKKLDRSGNTILTNIVPELAKILEEMRKGS